MHLSCDDENYRDIMRIETQRMILQKFASKNRLHMFFEYIDDGWSGTNVEQFLTLKKKYTDFSELTTPMISEFIDRIVVHAPEKIDGDWTQEVKYIWTLLVALKHLF